MRRVDPDTAADPPVRRARCGRYAPPMAANDPQHEILSRAPARERRLPPLWLIVLAAIGGCLLLIVAVNRWSVPSDEFAYWLAGQRLIAGEPLYDPAAPIGTPYAYWYPPPLAQVLAPLTLLLPDAGFVIAWTVLLLGCLWLLGDRRILVALALVAFVPMAVELWYRNVHLLLAVLFVLALRRHAAFWVAAAAIKITPVIGILYLVARGRYRDAAVVSVVGAAVLGVSVAISPGAWSGFLELVLAQGGGASASVLPVPYVARLVAAAIAALVAGRMEARRGEVLLVAALVLGNPSLTMTAFCMLAALVPLWLHPPARLGVKAAAAPPAVP